MKWYRRHHQPSTEPNKQEKKWKKKHSKHKIMRNTKTCDLRLCVCVWVCTRQTILLMEFETAQSKLNTNSKYNETRARSLAISIDLFSALMWWSLSTYPVSIVIASGWRKVAHYLLMWNSRARSTNNAPWAALLLLLLVVAAAAAAVDGSVCLQHEIQRTDKITLTILCQFIHVSSITSTQTHTPPLWSI